LKTQKWEQLFRQIDPAEYSNSGAIISANLPLMLKFLGNGRYMVLLGWLKHNLRAMANHKRNMKEVKQILRLHHERNTSIKQISRELAKSKNTVKECPRNFQASNLELTAAWSMDPAELSTLLLPGHSSATSRHA
jgi:hypothetical protein